MGLTIQDALFRIVFTLWREANLTGIPASDCCEVADGWFLIQVKPGGYRPRVAYANSNGEIVGRFAR